MTRDRKANESSFLFSLSLSFYLSSFAKKDKAVLAEKTVDIISRLQRVDSFFHAHSYFNAD